MLTPTLLLASPLQIGELVTWDVNEIVDLDVPGQGMKQVQLTFNISEDVDDITNRFMTMNKLDRHFRDQVREMIASVRHRSACLSVPGQVGSPCWDAHRHGRRVEEHTQRPLLSRSPA